MSTTVVVNGLNYFIPAVGENNWGQNVTDALVALATAASSNASVFNRVTVTSSPITVVSGRTYLVNTSATRTLNLPTPANNAYLIVKDATGNAHTNNITIHRAASENINGTAADYVCSVAGGCWIFLSDGTDWFLIDDPDITPYVQLNLTASIVNADIATGAAIAYAKLSLAGSVVNADIATGAAIAYAKLALTGSVVNADISASAAVALNKLAALGVSLVAVTDASGVLSTTGVTTTPTELNFVHGVTSAIQTQLAAKVSAASPTFTGTVTIPNGVNATDAAAVGQLHYKQTPVQATETTGTQTTSATYVDSLTTAAITPSSSSSKIKVTFCGPINSSIAQGAFLGLKRAISGGATTDLFAVGAGAIASSTSTTYLTFSYIDSPATASAVTYTVRLAAQTGSNTASWGGKAATGANTIIILEEVI